MKNETTTRDGEKKGSKMGNATMTKDGRFRKGAEVWYVKSWNNEDVAYCTRVTVASCGKKQMTLHDAASGAMLGHHFFPHKHNGNGCTIDCTKAEAMSVALTVAMDCISNGIKAYQQRKHEGNGYAEKQIARLKALVPSAIHIQKDAGFIYQEQR